MGKRRNTVVVVSSDDGDDDEDFTIDRNLSSSNYKSNRRNSKPVSKSKSRRNSSAKSTMTKKARLSHSLSSSAELLSNFDEFKFHSGDLTEDFAGFKIGRLMGRRLGLISIDRVLWRS